MIERTCKQCSKSFKAKPSVIKKGGGKYCCRECSDSRIRQSRKIKKQCEACNETIWAYPSGIKVGRGKYCGPACKAKAQITKVKRYCLACNIEFFVELSKAKAGRTKYCSKACMGKGYVLENHPNWKSGVIGDGRGYLLQSIGKSKRQRQHRLVMEKHLGRQLKRHEHIHHINGIRDDNRIENLQVLTRAEHLKLHTKNKSQKKTA